MVITKYKNEFSLYREDCTLNQIVEPYTRLFINLDF